ALGAVLATKFSALVLLPVAGLLILTAVWRPPAGLKMPLRTPIRLYGAGVETSAKIGANDPCPCGSGKKFRKCHGQSGNTARLQSGPAHKLARSILVFGAIF